MADNIYDRLGKITNYGQFELGPPTIPGDFIFKFLVNSADIKDLSTTSADTNSVENYNYPVNSGFIALISRCIIHIQDAGILPSKFGGINALTNGLKIQAIDDDGTSVLKDFLDGTTIKENGEFSHLAGVGTEIDAGAGDDSLSVLWDFNLTCGASLLLQSN